MQRQLELFPEYDRVSLPQSVSRARFEYGGDIQGDFGAGPHSIGQAKVEYGNTRDILTRASGFMGDYDFTLNPYSGCSYGCTYCYAAFFTRSSEKRDNWGYWVQVKENAADSLETRLRKNPRCLDGRLVYMSSVTDPYQPIERKLGLTRSILELLVGYESQVHLVVQTRSQDVVRDSDLYRGIRANDGKVQINMTVTTDDEEVREQFEPFCPRNKVRIRAIAKIAEEDLQACITMTPLLWLSNARDFARELAHSRVERFIIQPFHFNKGKFIAKTRIGAFELMAQKLGCPLHEFKNRYLYEYKRWRRILKKALESDGNTLGEGKSGFAPPFKGHRQKVLDSHAAAR